MSFGGGANTATLDLRYDLRWNRTGIKTANYSAAVWDLIPLDTTSNSITVTLPTAPVNGSMVAGKYVVKVAPNIVTFQCGGSDTINVTGGTTTATLSHNNESMVLVYDSSSATWTILRGVNLPSVLGFENGYTLRTSGTGFVWARPTAVIDETHSTTTFSNSTATNNLFFLSIPAGYPAVGDSVLFNAAIQMTNNSGGTITYNWGLTFGSTSLFTSGNINLTTSATPGTGIVQGEIRIESTTAQRIFAQLTAQRSTNGWMGAAAPLFASPLEGYGTSAENTTSGSKSLILTCTMSSASTFASAACTAASLIHIPKVA